jgi:hypothetical protein
MVNPPNQIFGTTLTSHWITSEVLYDTIYSLVIFRILSMAAGSVPAWTLARHPILLRNVERETQRDAISRRQIGVVDCRPTHDLQLYRLLSH